MGLKPLFLCCCFPSAEADGNRLLLLARFRSLFPQSVSAVCFRSLFPQSISAVYFRSLFPQSISAVYFRSLFPQSISVDFSQRQSGPHNPPGFSPIPI
jgi:hypothetical protein